MFSPIRRSILYFACARFVIAVPLKSVRVHEERALLCALKSADRLLAEQGLKATVASNDKRALVPESAPEVAPSLEGSTAAVKSVGGQGRQKRPDSIENHPSLPSEGGTQHRRAMLAMHVTSRIGNKLFTIPAFECLLWG